MSAVYSESAKWPKIRFSLHIGPNCAPCTTFSLIHVACNFSYDLLQGRSTLQGVARNGEPLFYHMIMQEVSRTYPSSKKDLKLSYT